MSSVQAVSLNFEPAHAAIGGAILGVATVGKLLLTGRVLGISGTIKGPVVDGDAAPWRFAFVSGLIAAGLLDAMMNPLQVAEPSAGLVRTAIAGLLVGAGSAMGNGCTSGHGICGNARFAPRSMAYTVVFMATGFAVATVFNTNAALAVASTSAINNMVIPAADTLAHWGMILAGSVAAFAGLGHFARRESKKGDGEHTKTHDVLNTVAEGLAGLVFGLGLNISGMRRAAKVSGFLSALSPAWDPSLALVMGGALALAIPGFASVNNKPKPACGREFGIPKKGGKIDRKLLVGGVMFGAGWGLAGFCPGPAIVSMAARPTAGLALWLGSVVLGMVGQKFVKL
eukprot:CAMPEP_0197592532 /NCGR_PEP_ID=MMETSP1326-20131121/15142_1 /TAXON_ID=1155430 /ORGANISM="Genus nov. species nov., Strain RCC2288" /LENGTH=341 /DNA_ID=CAMNT_0043158237 /DNA_START=104 /DNA_END=1129 /DNA_ORIENTATION=-